GEVVEARRRVGILRATYFFVDRPRALKERLRRGKLALSLQQEGETVEAIRRLVVLKSEHFFTDLQRALVERLGLGEVALSLQQVGEIVEAHRRARMLGAISYFADRMRALVERARRSIVCERVLPIVSGAGKQRGALLGAVRNCCVVTDQGQRQ